MFNFLMRNALQNRVKILPNVTLNFVWKRKKSLAVVDSQKYLQLSTDNNPVSLSQNRMATATATATIPRGEPLPLLDSTLPEVTRKIFDVSKPKIETKVTKEKSPLDFEEIPGPAILKLWEKYWKYVPLLGTQLFSSLLINNITQGSTTALSKLSWNRNITPLKYLFSEYGPIVRINGPIMGDVVLIHRPEHIAEVLKNEGDTPVRSGIDVLEHYRLHYRKYRLPGPFSMQSSEWLETKAKFEKPLAQQLSKYFGRLDVICDEFIHRIRTIRNRQDEVPGNFDKELLRWGMESFSILMFNKKFGFFDPTGFDTVSESSRIINALKNAHIYLRKCETGFQVWRFFETPYSRKLFEACDVIDGLVGKYIRQAQNRLSTKTSTDRQENEESSPIIERLLMNQKMHPDDISALLMDMIVLGVQATVNTQAFLLYFLAKNPRIQRKLYEEISSVEPNKERSLTTSSLEQMIYLKSCLRECLRLRPAFPYISRLLPKAITLHGYKIPKGTYLIMANQLSSQREENFEDPEKFKPDRWLDDQTDESPWQKFSCLPFGHGVRSCLGKTLAETEILLLTAKLIREFRIEYDYADIESKHLMVNVPNKPLRFRFVDRH